MISLRNLFIMTASWYLRKTNNYSKLYRFIQCCNLLMGIGTGAGVETSGELGAMKRALEKLPSKITIFDVGANKGQYASLLAKNIDEKDVDLHCFEPSKTAFSIIKNKIDSINILNVKVNNFALGKKQEDRTLWSNEFGSGLASLTKRRLDHLSIDFSCNEQVHVNTIDNYCKNNDINHIHILKIDTEGHELDVLAGAKNMFSQHAVDFVQFEFGGCNIDTRTYVQDFFYFFNEYGFTIHLITPSGYCMPMEHYQEWDEKFITTNYIAVSRKFMPI